MYREWTQTDYQNKHYNINQKDEEIQDDRGRDGGTNFISRIKEQETRLNLQEHDDDDDDDDDDDEVCTTDFIEVRFNYLTFEDKKLWQDNTITVRFVLLSDLRDRCGRIIVIPVRNNQPRCFPTPVAIR